MCVIITDHSFEICNCSILKKNKKKIVLLIRRHCTYITVK